MRPYESPDEFVEWLKKQSTEFLREGNKRERLQTEKDYKKFVTAFNKGECSLCNKPLKTFSAKSPCLHWLLRPKKFKKNISLHCTRNSLTSGYQPMLDGLHL